MTRAELETVIEYLEARLLEVERESSDVLGDESAVDRAGHNTTAVRAELLNAYRAFRREVRRG